MWLRFANLANELIFAALIFSLWKDWYGNNFVLVVLVWEVQFHTFFWCKTNSSCKTDFIPRNKLWTKLCQAHGKDLVYISLESDTSKDKIKLRCNLDVIWMQLRWIDAI